MKYKHCTTVLTLGLVTIIGPNLQSANQSALAQEAVAKATDQTAVEYQRDFQRIEAFRPHQGGDLNALEDLAKEIQDKWSKLDEQRYFTLMLDICQIVSSHNFGFDSLHQQELLARHYTQIALKQEAAMPLETVVAFIYCLYTPIEETAPQERGLPWPQLRNEDARLWLHVWQRINKELHPDYNFNQRFEVNIAPPARPDGSQLPGGSDPKYVQDPKARAQYEAAIAENGRRSHEFVKQTELRDLNKSFSSNAERYLTTLYSKSPYNFEELNGLLNVYLTDKDAPAAQAAKKRILTAVAENIAATKKQEAEIATQKKKEADDEK